MRRRKYQPTATENWPLDNEGGWTGATKHYLNDGLGYNSKYFIINNTTNNSSEYSEEVLEESVQGYAVEGSNNEFVYNTKEDANYNRENEISSSSNEIETNLNRFLASVGNLFSINNICWLLLVLVIVFLLLFILLKEEKKQKDISLLIATILAIIYLILCPDCFYCRIIVFVLLLVAVLAMFLKRKR